MTTMRSAPSRRDFLFRSSGAAAGTLLVAGSALAAEGGPAPALNDSSGLVTGRPKPLKRAVIPGFLSAEQIAVHHSAHYGGALKGYTALDAELEAAVKSGTAIGGMAYGAMQRAKASKANSVILHELYFDGMAPAGASPPADLRRAITARFGSLDNWAEDFRASAKASAGWALLVRHPVNAKLYNLVTDAHADGPMWMAAPLVLIDTYEHAFYVDYRNAKAKYAEKFIGHIDWDAAAARFRAETE